jgi:indolepyruvate decarboxylase
MVARKCPRIGGTLPPPQESDEDRLREALDEACVMLNRAKRPVVLAGVEIHRFGLQEALVRLIEHTGLPVAATLLGKSVISERHPQYLGVYAGALSRDSVRRVVENSDCLLILGAFMSDINLGIGSAKLDPGMSIYATSERIAIKYHHYEHVVLEDFIKGIRRKCERLVTPRASKVLEPPVPFKAQPKRALSVKRLFRALNDFIDDDFVVIADPGDAMFGSLDLTIHKRTEFISPAYYTSLGYAVPAALGAQIGARRRLRPLVLVGDGSFQIAGQEISTIARYGLNPIVLVLNNKGYTTERFLNEGPYNDILNWSYHRLPDILGVGLGLEVRTEGEFLAALETARDNKDSYSIINAHLEPMDCSDALMRLGKRMGALVRAEKGKQ